MKFKIIILFVLACTYTIQAQTILTVDEAIKIALEKNYDISISRNDGLAAKANNTAGNAGMLPNVGFNANSSVSTKNVRTKAINSNDYVLTLPNSSTMGANVSLNWTIFDGGKMFITKERLSEIAALGEIKYQAQVQQTISDVVAAYFNIVKLKQQLAAIEQTINYNKERLKIAETGFNAGARKKTDFLQAKIDLNVNLGNAINQQTLIDAAKRKLALLLALENDYQFDVISKISSNYTPNKEKLQQLLYTANKNILSFEKLHEIERLMLKEGYRSQLPRLDFNTGYYYQRSFNDLSSLSHSLGPQATFNLNVPIFQSGDLKRNIAISKLNLESANFELEKVKRSVNTELNDALTTFESQQKLLEIEQENNALAKENMEISLQRMRLGEATSLEVRMAQNDYEQSLTRMINFSYNLKVAETKLRQLIGDL